ncbi:MAG: prenyltransferase/squalene oxidase repeat-containing protein [Thermoguttaceae bacterium]
MASKPSESDAAKPVEGETASVKAETSAVTESPSESTPPIDQMKSTFWRDLIWATPSWLVSMVIHVIVVLVLAMFYLPPNVVDQARDLLLATGEDDALEELDNFEDEPLESLDVASADSAMVLESVIQPQELSMATIDEPATAVRVDLGEIGLAQAPATDLAVSVSSFSGGALAGRGEGKERLVRRDGGNDASEKAVSLALIWLAEHQMPDGGWNFDHALSPSCGNKCRNPGSSTEARNAATSMALLPFLGAGQTHREGQYKKVVNAGLYFLTRRMAVSQKKGGSLHEAQGNMYSHGLSSIVLCEAYAMTRDKGLYQPAQLAVNFIAYAQDPTGGGWRYAEQQAGDTSVVGWQIMALKSAHMGYLTINPQTVMGASKFLDSVQAKNGARYGYATPGDKPSTTAIGLLCRMHLGWAHDNPSLIEGVKYLAQEGPSPSDNYYNYYATQVMRHFEGDLWKEWNGKMRDQLVRTQAQQGHEKGSWSAGGGHSGRGGRLYDTSLSAMILEVYYRHLPLYRKQSTETEFSLD